MTKMKNMLRVAGAALCVASLPFVAVAQDANGPSSTIGELANAWVSAYNQGDSTALGALYTEGAVLYISGQPRVEGRSNIAQLWARDMGTGSPLTVLTVTDFSEGVDMRLVHGNYQVIDKAFGAVVGSGRFAHIWHRVGDQWLLDQDLWMDPNFGGAN